MPPAALISSTRIFMPFTVAFEKFTIGPDRSCAVPTTISFDDTPCCASAGVAAASASIAMMRFIVVFLRCPLFELCISAVAMSRSSCFPAVHRLDQLAVLLVHQFAFELHRGGELLVLGGELLLDQAELAHLLDASELRVPACV